MIKIKLKRLLKIKLIGMIEFTISIVLITLQVGSTQFIERFTYSSQIQIPVSLDDYSNYTALIVSVQLLKVPPYIYRKSYNVLAISEVASANFFRDNTQLVKQFPQSDEPFQFDKEALVTQSTIFHLPLNLSSTQRFLTIHFVDLYDQLDDYDLIVSITNETCFQECSFVGNCNDETQECICPSTHIGSYCQHELIPANASQLVQLRPFVWQYYVFDSAQTAEVYVTLRHITSEFYIAISHPDNQVQVPSLYNHSNYINPKDGIDQQFRIVQLNQPVYYIGFYNEVSIDFQFEIEQGNYYAIILKKSWILILLLICNVVLGMVFILYNTRSAPNFHARRRRHVSEQQSRGFNAHFLNKYLKSQEFGEFVRLQHEECIICLEDMSQPVETNRRTEQLRSLVTSTPCAHLFHTKCLKTWLQNARYCPYCREEFTKEILVKHQRKIQAQINLQKSSPDKSKSFNSNDKSIYNMVSQDTSIVPSEATSPARRKKIQK